MGFPAGFIPGCGWGFEVVVFLLVISAVITRSSKVIRKTLDRLPKFDLAAHVKSAESGGMHTSDNA